MTTQIKVVSIEPENKLIEVMQRTKLRYAFAKQTSEDTYECIMPYVMCRDFLKDVCYANFAANGEKLGKMYGFNADDPKLLELDKDRTVLVLTATRDLLDGIEKQADYLTKVEDKLGVVNTQMTRVDLTHMLVIGDPRWQQSLLGISYYSFLFRWMAQHLCAPSAVKDEERQLVKNATILENLDSIDKINYKGFFPEAKLNVDVSLGTIHNYYGLYWLNQNYREILNGTVGKKHILS
jgi:hypothetical protein